MITLSFVGIHQQPYLIIIHDCIQRLNPHGINVSIQHYPFGTVVGHIGHITHDAREQT